MSNSPHALPLAGRLTAPDQGGVHVTEAVHSSRIRAAFAPISYNTKPHVIVVPAASADLPADGNYAVDLEMALEAHGTFVQLARLTNDDDKRVAVFDLALEGRYRLRYVLNGGVEVKWMMGA